MMNEDIRECLSALLYNFWIVRDENPELYYKIKYNQNSIKDFVVKNLGSNLIVHNRFIKLEKLPVVVNENTGIDSFSSVLDYIFLCLFLMFLEDKTRGDRFILSDLIEYIKNTSVALELDHVPDWNKVDNRRSLINVLDFLKEQGVILVRDEDKVSFMDSKDAEALYEVCGISNYVMRIFEGNINNITSPSMFLASEFLNQDYEKGDVRRYKVFRNILYTPCVSVKNISESEVDYLKKNRFYIKSEINRKLDMEVEITNNMAMLYDDVSSLQKDNFPNTKKITEIVLMVNARILEDIQLGKLVLDDYETVVVKDNYLERIIREIKEEKKPYLGKTYEKFTLDKFYTEVFRYMLDYNFISKKDDYITIYPIIGRMIGKTCEVKEEKLEQVSLFGGEVDE